MTLPVVRGLMKPVAIVPRDTTQEDADRAAFDAWLAEQKAKPFPPALLDRADNTEENK